ncbi:MAG: hypothetical protein LBU66_08960 [Treponema sp.]|jgi:hypothetical protein|nr:hypothetical protein [Treponema sp.]
MKKLNFLFVLILLPVFIGAADFGLLLNQNAGVGNTSGENAFEYSAALLPRYSFPIGGTGSFIMSAGLTYKYVNDESVFIPELMRAEFSMLFGEFGIRAGRITCSTPLVIADNLFDGFQFTHTSLMGKFGFGMWYSGLLCKNTLDITMTKEDVTASAALFDWENFADTYFTSKRLIVSADWENPLIAELFSMNAAFTGQFDMNDHETKYHSQYLMLNAGFPVNSFLFKLGGALELSQFDSENNTALAGEIGVAYTLPASFNSRLAFNMIYASGKTEGGLDAFVPITASQYGMIFQSKITGLTVLSLDYSARITDSLGVSFAALYFVRNDLMIYDTYPVQALPDEDSYWLGGEFSGRLVWSLFSDLQLILGGGVFIPAMGDVWKDSNPVMKADLKVLFLIR